MHVLVQCCQLSTGAFIQILYDHLDLNKNSYSALSPKQPLLPTFQCLSYNANSVSCLKILIILCTLHAFLSLALRYRCKA